MQLRLKAGKWHATGAGKTNFRLVGGDLPVGTCLDHPGTTAVCEVSPLSKYT